MINVCDSIADKCKVDFGKDSIIIPNASKHYSTELHECKGEVINIILLVYKAER